MHLNKVGSQTSAMTNDYKNTKTDNISSVKIDLLTSKGQLEMGVSICTGL